MAASLSLRSVLSARCCVRAFFSSRSHVLNVRLASTSALGLKPLSAIRTPPAAVQSKGQATAAAAAAAPQFPRPASVAYDQSLANSIHLIGSVGVNVGIEYLDSGKIVATSSLSVKKTAQGEPTWFFLEFQSDLAEVAAQHVRKGDRIHVAGRVVVDSVTAENESVSQALVKVEVTELHFVDDTYGAQAQALKPAAPQLIVQRGTTGRTAGSREEKKQVSEKIWNEFFANPRDWYDNRVDKRNPKAPDFKHKSSGEALWIVGFYNPSNVVQKIAELESAGVLAKVEAAAAPPDTPTAKPAASDEFRPY